MERRENFSRKRQAILDVLRQTDVHPTADWVYRQLKAQYPALSLGTVYRNLGRLCENGQAVSLGAVNGQERFDGNTSPHTHLICSRCGSVIDVPGVLPDQNPLCQAAQSAGCRVDSASVTFRGLCPACAKKEEEAQNGVEADHL